MSDLEYLSSIADGALIAGSSLVTATGSIENFRGAETTGQTIVSYSPPTDSTFFLVEASCGTKRDGTISWYQYFADLRIATDVIENVHAGSGGLFIGSGGAGATDDHPTKFANRGNKLVGNGESSIAIHFVEAGNNDATNDVYGTIFGILIGTGESPRLP